MKTWYMGREEPEDPEYLTDRPDYYELSRPAKPEEVTADQLAEWADREAENGNRHDFAGCHVALLKLLRQHTSETATLAIMRAIAEADGLFGLGCR